VYAHRVPLYIALRALSVTTRPRPAPGKRVGCEYLGVARGVLATVACHTTEGEAWPRRWVRGWRLPPIQDHCTFSRRGQRVLSCVV